MVDLSVVQLVDLLVVPTAISMVVQKVVLLAALLAALLGRPRLTHTPTAAGPKGEACSDFVFGAYLGHPLGAWSGSPACFLFSSTLSLKLPVRATDLASAAR